MREAPIIWSRISPLRFSGSSVVQIPVCFSVIGPANSCLPPAASRFAVSSHSPRMPACPISSSADAEDAAAKAKPEIAAEASNRNRIEASRMHFPAWRRGCSLRCQNATASATRRTCPPSRDQWTEVLKVRSREARRRTGFYEVLPKHARGQTKRGRADLFLRRAAKAATKPLRFVPRLANPLADAGKLVRHMNNNECDHDFYRQLLESRRLI